MAETYGARLNKHQEASLKEMVKRGDADNPSEALRMALDSGLAELGYSNGTKTNTMLKQIVQRTADAFALLGVFWIGMTFLFPIGLRAFAIPIFAVAVALYGTDRALAAYEPRVSRRLFGERETA